MSNARGGRIAVTIEGHAESLVAATDEGVVGVDRLAASTERLKGVQATSGAGGFASYTSQTRSSTRATQEHSKATDKLGNVLKGAGGSIAAFAGAYAGYSAVKDAISYTEQLAHETEILSSVTGLDAKSASQWIELAKQRQIETTKLQIGFSTLSKQIRSAETGSTTAAKGFHALGIPLVELRKLSTQEVLLKISDGLKGMNNEAEKAALTQQFFGKSGRSLLPILQDGSAALQDNMNKFSGLTAAQEKQAKKVAEVQRNISRAYDQIRIDVTFAMLDAGKSVAKWISQVEQGKGDVAKTIQGIAHILGPTFKNILSGAEQFFKGFAQTIKGVCELIQAIMHGDFTKAWQGVKDIFSGGVKATIGLVHTIASPIIGIFSALGVDLNKIVSGIWGDIKGVFKAGINDVIGLVNDIIGVINVLPGVNIGTVGSIGDSVKHTQPNKSGHGPGPSHRYTGGPIDRPMAIVGEEAPQHPEWVIATNPAYRRDNLTYWAQAGHDLGIPGFGLGGLIGGAASSVGSAVSGTASSIINSGASAAVGALPTPHLPGWIAGLGTYVLNQIADWIKSGFQSKKFGHISGGIGGGFSGPWVSVEHQIAKRKGWNLGDWNKVIQKESGGVPGAKNPTSTAWGLGQLLSSNWGTFGGAPGSTPVQQIMAMGRYIAATYGNPTKAWAHEQSAGWYAKGGSMGTATRAVQWAQNNLGTQQGSAKQQKWARITHGPLDPWCAEFVGADMLAQGLSLPSNPAYSGSYTNWSDGQVVGHSIGAAQPGDLLNFSNAHIAIYKGGGQMISGNFSNQVMETPVSAGPAPLSAVIRPNYASAAGGKGKTKPKLIRGLGRAIDISDPGLLTGTVAGAATGLPPSIQALLRQPGLTFAQKFAIGQHAASLASGTASTADDVSAASYLLGLDETNKARIQRQLRQVAKDLHKRQSHKQRLKSLAKRGRLLASDLTVTEDIQTEQSTIDAANAAAAAQTQQDLITQLEQTNALLKQQVDNQNAFKAISGSNWAALAEAVTAVVSGQIGGRVGLGFQTPATPGRVASY
jgi:hypothetical protein